jgi:hypothetical protein
MDKRRQQNMRTLPSVTVEPEIKFVVPLGAGASRCPRREFDNYHCLSEPPAVIPTNSGDNATMQTNLAESPLLPNNLDPTERVLTVNLNRRNCE